MDSSSVLVMSADFKGTPERLRLTTSATACENLSSTSESEWSETDGANSADEVRLEVFESPLFSLFAYAELCEEISSENSFGLHNQDSDSMTSKTQPEDRLLCPKFGFPISDPSWLA